VPPDCAPLPPYPCTRLDAAWQLPPELEAALTDGGEATGAGPGPARPLVVIDFGSMGQLGLLPPQQTLLAVLIRALNLARM
jgi:hypothetical protein